MKMRLVLELDYPNAVHVTDEEAIKTKLSERMLALAKEGAFTAREPGELVGLEVSEVMVGCARIEELPTVEDPSP
jgi:hypothetical protein